MKNLLSGSSGSQVRRLQQRLREFGFYKGEINGYFDEDTEAAVRAFQKDRGLAEDGIVALITLHELDLLEPESGGRQISGEIKNA